MSDSPRGAQVAAIPPAIRVASVSKMFRLFPSAQHRLWEALHPFKKKYHQEFWALRNVSFDVEPGRTVGIIGRNGSGKSTLLQVICSILKPTSGSIETQGRISALLELGAAFNPNFSGRENVRFHAIRAGFTPAEAEARLPKIEEFAEIGEFFDQPTRIYSSGMFVRLAFAAAIHIDPEILVVDEALAVGDARFRHKCYAKFHEFQAANKTILLVTHDSEAILKHCDQAILLERGECLTQGRPKDVVHRYVDLLESERRGTPIAIRHDAEQATPKRPTSAPNSGSSAMGGPLAEFLANSPAADRGIRRANYNPQEYRQRSSKAEIVDFLVVTPEREDASVARSGDDVEIYLKARFHDDVEAPQFGFSVKTVDGVMLYALNTFFAKRRFPPARIGDVVTIKFRTRLAVAAGHYFIDLGVDEQVSPAQFVNLERRSSVIHLEVQATRQFHGLVDLDATFEEIHAIRDDERAAA